MYNEKTYPLEYIGYRISLAIVIIKKQCMQDVKKRRDEDECLNVFSYCNGKIEFSLLLKTLKPSFGSIRFARGKS